MAYKVSELAKELQMTEIELLSLVNSLGITARTSGSALDEKDEAALRKAVADKNQGAGGIKRTGGVTRRVPKKETQPVEEPQKAVENAGEGDDAVVRNISMNKSAVRRIKKKEEPVVQETVEEPTPKVEEAPVAPVEEKKEVPVVEQAPQVEEEKEEKQAVEESKPMEKKEAPKAKAQEAPKKEEVKEESKAKANPGTKGTAKAAPSTSKAKTQAPAYDDGRQKLTIIKRASEDDTPKPAPRKRPAQGNNAPAGDRNRKPRDNRENRDHRETRDNRGEGNNANNQRGARLGRPAGETRSDNRGGASFGGGNFGGESRGNGRGQGGRSGSHGNQKNNNRYEKKDNYPTSLEKKAKKKHVKQRPEAPVEEEVILPVGTKVVNVPITIAGFCEQVGVTIPQVIMALLKMGVVANQNQNIDEVTVSTIADELGINVVIGSVEEEVVEEGIETFEDREKDLHPRAPIITVMGHVDHGKTSLLDAIRKTNVTASESGGITQHIGASEVEINGQKIVFLDTPGHEAFTAMRARGADITDIAVLVVAADDSVKPQTIESISHAKAAGVPIIVAINKMDKPGANPDIVKKDLSDHGVLVEEWGGDVICVPVSAKSGDGIRNLLEMILLQAEMQELKANPNRLAMGTVIEARLDKAKGPIATLLVSNGTLKTGQSIVAGTCAGRIRLMTNHKGETIRKAGPATAVEVLGLSEVPAAGDKFNAVADSHTAKEIAESRKLKQREEVMARTSGITLEELFSSMQDGEVKELNLIVKGDVMGSVGAVNTSLEKLSNDKVKVRIIHSGVGAINESDVSLAGTSGAIIIGFNVRPMSAVQSLADSENVQIRTYRVIYDIIDDVNNAMKGMLDPEFKEEVLGEAEIRDTFKVPGVGVIGGGYVTKGKIARNAGIRLVRDGIVIHEGSIGSLKRFKDDAKEVAQGYECGIGIDGFNDVKVGDMIECYRMVEVEREN